MEKSSQASADWIKSLIRDFIAEIGRASCRERV